MGDPTTPKIPTHDVRRKDTAAFCLMEFNETSTIYSTVLLKSYVKVSEEEIVFWSKDTAHMMTCEQQKVFVLLG